LFISKLYFPPEISKVVELEEVDFTSALLVFIEFELKGRLRTATHFSGISS
jgi:hypothetical protein